MKNKNILEAFMQKVWNEKDVNAVEEFVSGAYTIHIDTGDPWEGKTLNHDEFRIRLQYSFDSFPDINFDIHTLIEDGDYVAITWTMTGTNTGKIASFPATNKPIKTEGATIYRFIEGKVCGHSQVFDRTTVMKQLGFM